MKAAVEAKEPPSTLMWTLLWREEVKGQAALNCRPLRTRDGPTPDAPPMVKALRRMPSTLDHPEITPRRGEAGQSETHWLYIQNWLFMLNWQTFCSALNGKNILWARHWEMSVFLYSCQPWLCNILNCFNLHPKTIDTFISSTVPTSSELGRTRESISLSPGSWNTRQQEGKAAGTGSDSRVWVRSLRFNPQVSAGRTVNRSLSPRRATTSDQSNNNTYHNNNTHVGEIVIIVTCILTSLSVLDKEMQAQKVG